MYGCMTSGMDSVMDHVSGSHYMPSADKHLSISKGDTRSERISFKLTPYKTEDIFTAEFLEIVKNADPEVCITYLENKEPDHSDYVKLEMGFKNVEKRDKALDDHVFPQVNALCMEKQLERKVWCFPLRHFYDLREEIDEGLMLYVVNLPPTVTHAQLSELVPEAEEIDMPLSETGMNLSHATMKFSSIAQASFVYYKGLVIDNVKLAYYKPVSQKKLKASAKLGKKSSIAIMDERLQRGSRRLYETQRDRNNGPRGRYEPGWARGRGGRWAYSHHIEEMDRMQTQMELQMMRMRQQLQHDMRAQVKQTVGEIIPGDGSMGRGNPNTDGEGYGNDAPMMSGSGYNQNRNWGTGAGYGTNSGGGYGNNPGGVYGLGGGNNPGSYQGGYGGGNTF